METSSVEAQRAPESLATALMEGCKETWSRPAWSVAAHHRIRALALLEVARRIGVQLSAHETPASFDAKVIDELQRLSELLSHASARAKLHADRGTSDAQPIDGVLEGWIACGDGSLTVPFQAPQAPAGFLRLDLRVTRVVDGVSHWGWCIASNPTSARNRDTAFGIAPGEQLGDTEYDMAWRAALDAEVAARCWRASVSPGDYSGLFP